MARVEYKKPCELQPHKLNEEIYGDRADADMVASVRAKGVLNPLLITSGNVIISGHRRWGAALAAGLELVPVVIFGSDDPLDIEEALIESNRQRQKTNEQIGREYKQLKRILNERLSKQGARTDLTSGSREPEAKPPVEHAAEELGVSKPTAVRIEAVIDRIDDLRTNGQHAQAEELRQELERSAKAAYNKVRAELRQEERRQAPPLLAKPSLPPNIKIHNADSRHLHRLDIEPVHLVVTSPPYNVGVEYGAHDDQLSNDEYLVLVGEVFRQCYARMVDGARIAVVVPFGVGRNPWVPFAGQVMGLLQSGGFTLRGQIIWDKGTSGNRTSWGSFRLPTDPSLRDTTEAIIVAHKGSGKLSIPEEVKRLDAKGTHTEALADAGYFMELAQDHWVIAPESAGRVGHPAPFPVTLAKRLIDFYAYQGAHILDPFCGSGSTGVAALQAGCDATLVDIDPEYCRLAEERLSR